MSTGCDPHRLIEWSDLTGVLQFTCEFPSSVRFGLSDVRPTENYSFNSPR